MCQNLNFAHAFFKILKQTILYYIYTRGKSEALLVEYYYFLVKDLCLWTTICQHWCSGGKHLGIAENLRGACVNACPLGLWHLFVHVQFGFSSYMRGQNSCQNGYTWGDVSQNTIGIFLLLRNSKMRPKGRGQVKLPKQIGATFIKGLPDWWHVW